MSYSAVIPCYNEERYVRKAYHDIRVQMERYEDFELIFIDDGSSDRTLEIIKEIAAEDKYVKFISFSRNFGLETAFRAGFKYAEKDWIVQFDADLQSPPGEVHKLIDKALDGYDVVFARRKGRQDPWFRKMASRCLYFLAKGVLKIDLPQEASVFRIVKATLAKRIVGCFRQKRYFIANVPMVTQHYGFVETEHHQRVDGGSRWSTNKLIAHGFELFMNFSPVPLRAVTFTALVLVLANLMLSVQVSNQWLQAVATVCSVACIAMLAEYLLRMQCMVQNSGEFFIRESNLDVLPTDRV